MAQVLAAVATAEKYKQAYDAMRSGQGTPPDPFAGLGGGGSTPQPQAQQAPQQGAPTDQSQPQQLPPPGAMLQNLSGYGAMPQSSRY